MIDLRTDFDTDHLEEPHICSFKEYEGYGDVRPFS